MKSVSIMVLITSVNIFPKHGIYITIKRCLIALSISLKNHQHLYASIGQSLKMISASVEPLR
jgi:hypothetical protein